MKQGAHKIGRKRADIQTIRESFQKMSSDQLRGVAEFNRDPDFVRIAKAILSSRERLAEDTFSRIEKSNAAQDAFARR